MRRLYQNSIDPNPASTFIPGSLRRSRRGIASGDIIEADPEANLFFCFTVDPAHRIPGAVLRRACYMRTDERRPEMPEPDRSAINFQLTQFNQAVIIPDGFRSEYSSGA